jgi:hypothetical protein
MTPLDDTAKSPSIASPVLWLLRLEGLAVAVLSVLLYLQLHGRVGLSWWWFAALWLVPDLSMVGYAAGPRYGAACYNAVHAYLLPALLVVAGLVSQRMSLIVIALIWFNHIGVDRLLGYGLKYSTGFGHTHLQTVKRRI